MPDVPAPVNTSVHGAVRQGQRGVRPAAAPASPTGSRVATVSRAAAVERERVLGGRRRSAGTGAVPANSSGRVRRSRSARAVDQQLRRAGSCVDRRRAGSRPRRCGEQLPAQRRSRPAAGCPGRPASLAQLGALVDVRHAGHGRAASASGRASWSSRGASIARRTRSTSRTQPGRRSTASTSGAPRPRTSASGSIQAGGELRPPGRPSQRRPASRSARDGQAPTDGSARAGSSSERSGSGRAAAPARQRVAPTRRDLGEHREPGAHVLAALGVVGRQRGHRVAASAPAGRRCGVELVRRRRRSGPGRRRPR